MSDTLKPCPFCGGDAVNNSHVSCDCCGKPYTGEVACVSPNCGAMVNHFDTDSEAIKAWNTRIESSHLRECVEACDRLMDAVRLGTIEDEGRELESLRAVLSKIKGEQT